MHIFTYFLLIFIVSSVSADTSNNSYFSKKNDKINNFESIISDSFKKASVLESYITIPSKNKLFNHLTKIEYKNQSYLVTQQTDITTSEILTCIITPMLDKDNFKEKFVAQIQDIGSNRIALEVWGIAIETADSLDMEKYFKFMLERKFLDSNIKLINRSDSKDIITIQDSFFQNDRFILYGALYFVNIKKINEEKIFISVSSSREGLTKETFAVDISSDINSTVEKLYQALKQVLINLPGTKKYNIFGGE